MHTDKKTYTVLLVQIVNRNLGDAVIADNTVFLIQKALPKRLQKHTQILRYNIQSQDRLPLTAADAIVFAGGGLIKFKQEHFYEDVIRILEQADALQIPVFFNAVGVEGYDEEDERCQRLKAALQLPCVKGITCRDDIETLQKNYLPESTVPVYSVPDVAVLSSTVYARQLQKKSKRQQPLIGLGITRERLFSDYGNEDINKEYLLQFWKETTELLEEKGYAWCVFTNGLDRDEVFATKVLDFIGHGERVPAPAEPRQLAQNIQQFDGIIAGRMHTHILAFTLGVPSVGFVWNDKVRFWSNRVGTPERFVMPENLQAESVVSRLEAALEKGVTPLPKESKQSLLSPLRNFLESALRLPQPKAASGTPEKASFAREHMVALGLGSALLQYDRLNSPEALQNSLRHGFRYVHVDIRLDADGTLVCVNGWNRNTYRRLGLPLPEEGPCPPLSTEKFLQQHYYGLYQAATLADVLRRFRKLLLFPAYADARLILDIGTPETGAQQELFFQKLWEAFQVSHGGPFLSSQHIMIRLRRKKDYELLRAAPLDFTVIYQLPKSGFAAEGQEQQLHRQLQFCQKKKIPIVSVSAENWNQETAVLCKEAGKQVMVFSYSGVDDLARALALGADFVVSRFYTPDDVSCYIQNSFLLEQNIKEDEKNE